MNSECEQLQSPSPNLALDAFKSISINFEMGYLNIILKETNERVHMAFLASTPDLFCESDYRYQASLGIPWENMGYRDTLYQTGRTLPQAHRMMICGNFWRLKRSISIISIDQELIAGLSWIVS